MRGKLAGRSLAYVPYVRWIERHYRTQGAGKPFSVAEMMAACGEDINIRRDYTRAMTFLMKSRHAFRDVMDAFFQSDEFQKHMEEGNTPEQIFRQLMEASISWGVYPVYSDAFDDNMYKLFDLASFTEIMRRRRDAIATEIDSKTKMIKTMVDNIPGLKETAMASLISARAYTVLPNEKRALPEPSKKTRNRTCKQ